jgi:hypothetical protein
VKIPWTLLTAITLGDSLTDNNSQLIAITDETAMQLAALFIDAEWK